MYVWGVQWMTSTTKYNIGIIIFSVFITSN